MSSSNIHFYLQRILFTIGLSRYFTGIQREMSLQNNFSESRNDDFQCQSTVKNTMTYVFVK